MDTWYSVNLGDGVEAFKPTGKIQEAFLPVFATAGCPPDMAVFSKYPVETNIVTIYFTPAAHLLAKMFDASPCEPPTKEGIALLAGDARCWQIFFPDTNS